MKFKAPILFLGMVLVLALAAGIGIGCSGGGGGSVPAGHCASGCPYSALLNGQCDSACNNAACSYDNGACGSTGGKPTATAGKPTTTPIQQTGYCSESCKWEWVGDGECDDWTGGCNTASCNWDGGDCSSYPTATQSSYCSTYCPSYWIADGVCDWTECYNAACNWDGGDCANYCADGCPNSYIGDTWCDQSCYNAACQWDGGDCNN